MKNVDGPLDGPSSQGYLMFRKVPNSCLGTPAVVWVESIYHLSEWFCAQGINSHPAFQISQTKQSVDN